jgi:dTDP-4-amino-4,6-dideoxygalactose transaminase
MQKLPNASIIDQYGFYVPNHPGLSKTDILKITNIIKEAANEVDPYMQTK